MVKISKIKKQHYVPQSYLEFFACNDSHKINVYDKEKLICRPRQNIKDIACESYFYDIDWEDKSIKEKKLSYLDKQILENYFSGNIENTLSMDIKFIKEKVEKNDFINKLKLRLFLIKKRKKIVEYIYIQHCRTWQYKEDLRQTCDLMNEFIDNIDYSGTQIQEIKKEIKKILQNDNLQNLMLLLQIFKSENLLSVYKRLKNYFFVILYTSDNNFITSDNPIVTKGHIENQYMSMNGLFSEGVEIAYPLTPNIILVLFENNFHKEYRKINNKVIVADKHICEYYNKLQTIESSRYLFSKNEDFKISNELCEQFDYIRYKNRKRIELKHNLKKQK